MYNTKFGPLDSLRVEVHTISDEHGVVGPFKTKEAAEKWRDGLNAGRGSLGTMTWTGTKALKALEQFEREDKRNAK